MLSLQLKQISKIPTEWNPQLQVNAYTTIAELERAPILHGNQTVPLAEFFRISGELCDDWHVEGDCAYIKRLGANWQHGHLHIHGNAGPHAGTEMRAGQLTIDGDAGDWLGAEMLAGKIIVHGNAGSRAGGCYIGSKKGMRNGLIEIHGDAGAELGCSMRRGIIIVHGDCGPFAGADMIAGTIIVSGTIQARIAPGMKRGSILCQQPDTPILNSFAPGPVESPTWVRLLYHYLQQQAIDIPWLKEVQVRRFHGDRLTIGHGEILVRSP